MSRRLLAVLFVGLLLVPTGVAAVEGQPNLSVSLPDDDVAPGQETTLDVQVMNTGSIEISGDNPQHEQRVTTARGVSVSVGSGDAPIEVRTGTRLLGSLPDGGVATAPFRISVKENAKPGTYRVPVHVDYEYTNQIVPRQNYHDEDQVSRTFYVTLHVEDSPQFEVVNASTDVPVGDSGTVSLTLQNDGSAVAHDARVTLRSGSSALRLGESGSASRFVGTWERGENRTVEVRASALDQAETRSYPVSATVHYENDDGRTAESESVTAGVTPLPKQSFTVSNVTSSLRVGEEGTVTATVTNDGPRRISEAVVRLGANANAVHPQRTEYAVGTLAPGASTQVSFPVEISDAGEAGPHQFRFTVEYQNREGETRESDKLPFTVGVAEERKQFGVEPVDVSVTAGSASKFTVAVTNNGDRPLSNVNAKLFVDSPLSASDDTAFAPTIAAGETVEMTFELSAAAGALAKPYPVEMDFQYETPEGEKKLSETYTVAADVNEPTDTGLSPVVVGGVVVLLLVLAGGAYWYFKD
ncbi:COG1361 S-layer family protein [Halospeciosus flavus]|uniref:COG1361 S-layer family protein n=1 Tax=Halospeciosus flavus TaxID=3032283 RepID=A0ABD5Z4H3_9EURY|nr:COG1361 S-layer family protein [Halospeciosus flavus]